MVEIMVEFECKITKRVPLSELKGADALKFMDECIKELMKNGYQTSMESYKVVKW